MWPGSYTARRIINWNLVKRTYIRHQGSGQHPLCSSQSAYRLFFACEWSNVQGYKRFEILETAFRFHYVLSVLFDLWRDWWMTQLISTNTHFLVDLFTERTNDHCQDSKFFVTAKTRAIVSGLNYAFVKFVTIILIPRLYHNLSPSQNLSPSLSGLFSLTVAYRYSDQLKIHILSV